MSVDLVRPDRKGPVHIKKVTFPIFPPILGPKAHFSLFFILLRNSATTKNLQQTNKHIRVYMHEQTTNIQLCFRCVV